MALPAFPVRPEPLTLSVGALCRRIDPIDAGTSLARASQVMVEEQTDALPVTQDGVFQGVLEEGGIQRALEEGWELSEPVASLVKQDYAAISPFATGAEALRILEQSRGARLVVIDGIGGVLGFMTPSRLVAPPHELYRPKTVGGMATPVGVYLTNGAIGAGVPWWALALTGAVLFGHFLLGVFLVTAIANFLPLEITKASWFLGAGDAVALAVFLVGLRLNPLAGIHGAEHMVVHAIERGEPLEMNVVKRMPRIHPRCGTNLAAGAMIFLGVMGTPWIPTLDLRLLAALLATVLLWRPVGAFLQHYVTTRKPTDAQLAMGIRSGEALLRAHQTSQALPPSPWQRIMSSGIGPILLGSAGLQLLVWAILELTRVPTNWRPF